MKQLQKISERICAIFLVALMMFQILPLHVLAAEIPDEEVNISTNDVPEDDEGSKFTLVNSDVQISDEYLPETAYISEIENPGYEMELPEREYPEGLVLTKTVGDPMVYLTQRWLNQEYSNVPGFGSVPENGKTGWDTVYGLLRALQHELGITELANNFGPTTSSLYSKNLLYRQDGVTNRMFAILQGALWCKGYSPGYHLYENADGTVSFDEVFDEKVERAIIELKQDAGLINPDGVVTVNVMKALMSMDSFKLLSYYGGDPQIREMQQMLNRKYEAYTGLTPCDGVYGRNTNKALVYALQAEEGLPVNVATGNFGNTTKLCCPQIPYGKGTTAARRYPGTPSSLFYTPAQIKSLTQLLQFALLVNGFDTGEIDGIYDDKIGSAILEFQEKLSLPQTGVADKTTWLSLFISCGDTSRSALAADCATILTPEKAKTLYDHGYRYIGRYLTGRLANGQSKAITREEAEIIFDAGLNFFPIFQTAAYYNDYFTAEQGRIDAKSAIDAATTLGIPANTIIYFAVDYDCMDYQITSNVIPYFKAVYGIMSKSIYKTGIYGTRNTCTRVSELGYACSSFVGDMSTGFSGNLGFSMPDNWAFDQFHTTSIGSGAGYLEIDKNGFSGKDHGVEKLNDPPEEVPLPYLTFGESCSDELVGPMLEILGHKSPAFEMPFGFSISPKNLIQYEDNLKEGTREITIGYVDIEHEEFEDNPYEHIKELIESFDKAPSTASWNSLKGIINNIKTMDFQVGFDMSGSILGYMKCDLTTGAIKESSILIVSEASFSIKAPVYPLIFFKYAVEGNLIANDINLVLTDSGGITLDGKIEYTVDMKVGLETDLFIANTYVGIDGGLTYNLDGFDNILANSTITANLFLFMEAQILTWGGHFEWNFVDLQIYPFQNEGQPQLYALTKDDLEFIEPINRVSTFSNSPEVFLPNVQTYTSPKIISLGDKKLLMLYIDDMASRTAENRTTLMFSYFDGTVWSSPLPVCDDGTADFNPEVCYDGNGGAHIVWQNANKVFDADITLEEMASNMELSYIHWDGSSFDEIVPITDNDTYESKHTITWSGDNICIAWQENFGGNLIGSTGTSQICRKESKNGKWQGYETIATGLFAVNSIDATYFGNKNVIAYTAKTNADTSSMDDLEVFLFDGSTAQLTNDTKPDYSVNFINDELYWISDTSVVSITNGQMDSMSTAIEQIPVDVSSVQVLGNGNGGKSIVWKQIQDSGEAIYISKYDELTKSFGALTPLSTGSGVIRGWDVAMEADGELQLALCAADMLDEPIEGRPYGQLDLIQKTADKFFDISVGQVVTYNENVKPNSEVTLTVDVYNNGSQDITEFDAAIISPNGDILQKTTISEELLVSERKTLKIPFVLPEELNKIQYTVELTPHTGEDIAMENNTALFTIGYADLAIQQVEEERTDTGRLVTVNIVNQGYDSADGVFKVIEGGPDQEILSSNTISQLGPGDTMKLTYEINENRLDASITESPMLLYLEIDSDEEESNFVNNYEKFYVYPDYAIDLSSGIGGSVSGAGDYAYDSTATLRAIPEPGYMFMGWYEDGKLIEGLSETYSFSVVSNRTLKAEFMPNNLSIKNIEIFGSLQRNDEVTFTIVAEGGQKPYRYEYSIYREDEICYSVSESLLGFLEWTPTETGRYNIVVGVTDSTGYKVSYSKQFNVS